MVRVRRLHELLLLLLLLTPGRLILLGSFTSCTARSRTTLLLRIPALRPRSSDRNTIRAYNLRRSMSLPSGKSSGTSSTPNPDAWQGMGANANSWLTMGKFLDCGSRQELTHSFPFNTLDGPRIAENSWLGVGHRFVQARTPVPGEHPMHSAPRSLRHWVISQCARLEA
jgi:hypothetical protein